MVISSQSPFVRDARAAFARLDRDSDGFLCQDEVGESLTDQDLKASEAAVAATLFRLRFDFGALSKVSNDETGPEASGCSLADLTGLEDDDLAAKVEEKHRLSRSATEHYSEQLFSGQPLTVSQGSLEDCWWLAPVLAQTAVGPAALQGAIRPEGDGYRVTFLDGKSERVGKPTLAECAAFASSGTSGHWLTALEKARGQANQGFLRDGIPQLALSTSPLTGALSQGIAQVTGDGADQDWLLWTSAETTRAKLSEHLSQDHLVVAATGPGLVPRLTGKGEHLSGLVPQHAYAVLGFDAETDLVRLANPWGETEWEGSHDGCDDGRFSMPLDEFHSLFAEVAYQAPATDVSPLSIM